MNSVYKTTLIASGGTVSELATACSICLLQLRGADPGIYVLYWRGVWGPPTGHAYILTFHEMTAEK